jgi:glycerol-3-phosphate dehydrogenase
MVPTYRGRFPSRAVLAAALAVNELFSADRNRGLVPDRAIPRARVLSRRECLALEPSLECGALTGGVLFHDALMYSPERLTLEVMEAAGLAGAVTANHVEFLAPVMAGGRVAGARIRDVLSGDTAAVRARWIVNATGSHVPELANRLAQHSPAAGQAYSVALSFVTRQRAGQVAFTVSAGVPDQDRVGRVGARQLFVVPWRGQTMIGTGHLEYRGDPAAFVMKPEYVERFAEEIAAARPDRSVGNGDIVLVHSGLLPISGRPRGGAVRLLKQHRIVDHTADGCPGALSVITVKFTTARRVALDVVNRIAPVGSPRTSAQPQGIALPGGAFESLERLRSEAFVKYAGLLPVDVLEHLVRTYGSRYAVVIEHGRHMHDWNQRVVADAPVIRAQLVHAAVAEQGRTPADLLWRRTELGPRGLATDPAYRAAEDVLAAVP